MFKRRRRRVDEADVEFAGGFFNAGVWRWHGKSVRCDPQAAARRGDGIDEDRRWHGVPGSIALDDRVVFLRPVGDLPESAKRHK